MALISVLLIFALVVILASDIASRQYLDTRSTANLLGMRQAEYYALGAEEWARQMLYRDRA
ncbi:MAG: type II secretion system protein GspK, partial [Spongiibacteraceae bacterium]|nr:type II secretion system protein GspK [Spongiibacteraceae bacterium]